MLIVLIFFCWQMINVFDHYFEYNTKIRFRFEINAKVNVPSLAICLSYSDALKFQAGGLVTEDNYDQQFSQIDSNIETSMNHLLGRLDTHQVVGGCYMRDWVDRMKKFIHYPKTECEKHFKVKKFFLNQRFCYQIEPRVVSLPFYRSDLRLLLIEPGDIYSLDLAKNFTFESAQGQRIISVNQAVCQYFT